MSIHTCVPCINLIKFFSLLSSLWMLVNGRQLSTSMYNKFLFDFVINYGNLRPQTCCWILELSLLSSGLSSIRHERSARPQTVTSIGVLRPQIVALSDVQSELSECWRMCRDLLYYFCNTPACCALVVIISHQDTPCAKQ